MRHSGGRSSGWIAPVRRCWVTFRSTCHSCSMLPGQLDRDEQLHRLRRADQPAVRDQPGQEERTSSCTSSTWWRSGGTSTVLGKHAAARPAPRRPVAGRQRDRDPQRRSARHRPVRRSAAVNAREPLRGEQVDVRGSRACRRPPALGPRGWPSRGRRRPPRRGRGTRPDGFRRWCTARSRASFPTPGSPASASHSPAVVHRPRPDGIRAATAGRSRPGRAGPPGARTGARAVAFGRVGRTGELDVHDAAGERVARHAPAGSASAPWRRWAARPPPTPAACRLVSVSAA